MAFFYYVYHQLYIDYSKLFLYFYEIHKCNSQYGYRVRWWNKENNKIILKSENLAYYKKKEEEEKWKGFS